MVDDVGLRCRLERRLRELYRDKMRSHEHRLDEWRRQHAGRDSLHSELVDTSDENEIYSIAPLESWVRMVHKIRLMATTYAALRKWAADAGLSAEQSMLDRYITPIAGLTTTGRLTFKVKNFRTAKEPKAPAYVVRILEKQAEYRTPEDLETIADLMEGLQSFRKYSRQMQLSMCRIVRYMKCQKRRTLLRKGHVAYSVYFVFSGAVSVDYDPDDHSIFAQKKLITLRKGAVFGEITMENIENNAKRMMTVVCEEESEFMVLDKEDYVNNGLDVLQQQEFQVRLRFFQQWAPLSRWSSSAVRQLSLASHTEDYDYNKIIVGDNTDPNLIWFVLNGECDVMKLVSRDTCRAMSRDAAHHALPEELRRRMRDLHFLQATRSGSHRDGRFPPYVSGCPETIAVGAAAAVAAVAPAGESQLTSDTNLHPSTDARRRSTFAELALSRYGAYEGALAGEQGEQHAVKAASSSDNSDERQHHHQQQQQQQQQQQSDNPTTKTSDNKLLKTNIKPQRHGAETSEGVDNIVFTTLTTLRRGDCYVLGIEREVTPNETALSLAPLSGRYVVVSRRCTMIYLLSKQLREIAARENVDLQTLSDALALYPDDYRICRHVADVQRWNSEKKQTVEELIVARANNIKLHNFRNHYTDPERLLEFRQPTYVDPSPSIKVRSHCVPPSQNPLVRAQRAHDVVVGIRAARAERRRRETRRRTKTPVKNVVVASAAIDKQDAAAMDADRPAGQSTASERQQFDHQGPAASAASALSNRSASVGVAGANDQKPFSND